MGVAQTIAKLTAAEYLALERAAEFKSEFFDGEMFARPSCDAQHCRIAVNLICELHRSLESGPHLIFDSNLRLKIEITGLFTYPDLAVYHGQPKLLFSTDDTAINPIVLFEVLSDSTEAYDRGKKFEHYRLIPSLKEYLLVSQKEPRIEQFTRQPDDRWLLNEAVGMNATLPLPSLGVSIELAEVFAGVEFTPTPIRQPTPPRH